MIRAQSLKRRFNGAQIEISLNETSIAAAVSQSIVALGLSPDVGLQYRRFENGRKQRQKILDALHQHQWIDTVNWNVEDGDLSDIENFSALVAAWVGALHHKGLTNSRPSYFVKGEGWVITPQLCNTLDIPPSPVL